MDILVSAEEVAELETKLDSILRNQQLLVALMQDVGCLLTRYGYYASITGVIDTSTDNVPDPAEMSNHIDERLQYLLDQYGETCPQTKAAKILSVTPQTIYRMMKAGTLRRVGTKVDVRSIYKYLEGSTSKKESVNKRGWKAKYGKQSYRKT